MSSTKATTAPTDSRSGKYLTFFLGDEEYGLEILKVSEIIGMQPITRVPRVPDFVRGVINLRGKVIPVTDLRTKFEMVVEEGRDACIIVVQMKGLQTGVIVDRVSEVVAIADHEVEDAPSFGAGIRTEYLLGIGKAGGRVKLLVNIDKVLESAELAAIEQLAASGAA